jgi:hypothetical protein
VNNWVRRFRGTIGMGITWAVGWGLVGLLIGLGSIVTPFLPWEAFFNVFDAPLLTLAIPGFFGGVLSSMVLGIAGRNRRFDELSLPWFVLVGAFGGLLLAIFPAVLVTVGLATLNPNAPGLLALTGILGVPMALLGSASAAGTLVLARKAEGGTLQKPVDPASLGKGG